MGSIKRRKWRKKSSEQQENHFLAKEAVVFLIEESLKTRSSNPRRSQELFIDARNMGKRGRLHLPKSYRRLFCRFCYYPLSIKTAKIRLNSKKQQIHYLCLNCKRDQRFGYSRNRKSV